MDKKVLEEEKQYLQQTISALKADLADNKQRQEEEKQLYNELLEYYSSNSTGIDSQEKASIMQMLEEAMSKTDHLLFYETRIYKQLNSPYFGRFDFKASDEKEYSPYYIGVYNVMNEQNNFPLVCDWRAPVSSMYYDYETGNAKYTAPMGEVEGNINLKRQFKIENGKIKLYFDTKETIGDEILCETLGQSTDTKMKDIVSTIQKEQNKIIREDKGVNLLVQGVAGSGKTSVALHRVAFLLYQNRQTLSARDILIVSPNRIFSEYISNVLPELGEENLEQITFDEIAKEELTEFVGKIQTRAEMLEDVIVSPSQRNKEIQYKSGFEFYEKFDKYLNNFFDTEFVADDIIFGEKYVAKEIIDDLYKNKYKSKTPAVRISWIADFVLDKLNITSNVESVHQRVKRLLYPFFTKISLEEIYSDFLKTQNMVFDKKDDAIKYEDVAPLMYIKNYLLGLDVKEEVKHLIVDEMQDYTPIHFAIFNSMYNATKTLLGDIYQCIEKTLDNEYLEKLEKMTDSKLLKLNKCYRSTKQITQLAKDVINCEEMQPYSRDGESPEIVSVDDNDVLIATIESKIFEWKQKYNRIAIITNTEEESANIYEQLKEIKDISHLCSGNQQQTKIMVVSSILSKGLEFDAVIYLNNEKNKNKILKNKIINSEKPHNTDFVDNFNNLIDLNNQINKKLMFISITRALHQLFVISY